MQKLFILSLSAFLFSFNTNATSIIASDDHMWYVGCDGKVYERGNESHFKQLATELPKGVEAQDLLYREILVSGVPGGVGSAAPKYDKVLYVVSKDGRLFAAGIGDKEFKLSRTQLPPEATRSCSKAAAPPPAAVAR